EGVLRPMSLEVDRAKRWPDEILERLAYMRDASPGADIPEEYGGEAAARKGPKQTHRFTMVGSEELAWGDAAILLCLPGPGLGGPPPRLLGPDQQRRPVFGNFKQPGLHFGAYGLTEPGAGSDVSAIRTSCRRDGDNWILNGRKCFITNGARADWVVIFATVDPKLGRAGHRAFVVEKGTPGFSVGKVEDKMRLRA